MAEGIPTGDGEGIEIDLRDRLIFAAGSLAADFVGALPTARAEELVFSSADRLLALASVTEFVPILAERDARRTIRIGGGPTARAQSPVPAPRISVPPPQSAVPAPRPAVPARPAPAAQAPPPAPAVAVAPLVAVPDDELTRLWDRVERARQRVAEWQAQLSQR